jgi:hypothetical protein
MPTKVEVADTNRGDHFLLGLWAGRRPGSMSCAAVLADAALFWILRQEPYLLKLLWKTGEDDG